MEPQLPQVNLQSEGQSVPRVAPEQSVNVPEATPESPIKSPEVAKNTEKSNSDNLGQVMPTATGIQTQDITQQSQAQPTSDNADPTAAADSDVIEKEWINKVKAIVSKTSDDPYQQQHQVSKLMVDYVLKRYGRIIGENNG